MTSQHCYEDIEQRLDAMQKQYPGFSREFLRAALEAPSDCTPREEALADSV